MPLSQGQTLKDRYRIVKLLGQGGFGAVYRCWDITLQSPRALKENLDTSAEAQRQFKREAMILSQLSHPNLPMVSDYFVIPEQGQYLVMDYVEGQDLEEILTEKGGSLPEAQALAWIGQVCDALDFLHGQQPPVIHRDIKPANIKITPDGQTKLVDFGIAKVYDAKLSTTIGARAVTPGFSPLEQYGTGSTDARTDIYALGATLYQLLTGEEPVESIQRNLDIQLPTPRSLNPTISPQTEAAILKAMELLPARRFQSADEFKIALTAATPATQTAAMPVTVAASTVNITNQTPATQVFPPSEAPPSPPGAAPVSRPWWSKGVVIAAVLVVLGLFAITLAMALSRATVPTSEAPAVVVITATSQPTDDRPATNTVASVARDEPTATRQPTNTRQPTAVPTDTRRPPTDTPRPTNTPVPAGPPILVMDQNYLCRGGPGTQYVELWSFLKGDRKEIIGKSGDGWYLVLIDDERTRKKQCWVGGGVVDGNESQIPLSSWTGDGY